MSNKSIHGNEKITWAREGTRILYKEDCILSRIDRQIMKKLIAQGTPNSFRKKLWMQCSGALREMRNNPKYYQNLLEYSNKIKGLSDFQIGLDLKRTYPDDIRCLTEEFNTKLKNILKCFSIRNITIGYCQGMNFIVGKILLIIENEEEAFWLFTQIVEYILPLNYFPDLAGLLTETTVISVLISNHLPTINAFIKYHHFEQSANNFIHKWLVSLFTQNFKESITFLIWDYLFIEGNVALSKSILGILSILHNEILKEDNFESIYSALNDKTNNIFNHDSMLYFLDKRVFEFNYGKLCKFRQALQGSIIENLNSEKKKRDDHKKNNIHNKVKKKKKEKKCNPTWPFCTHDDTVYEIPETIVLKYHKKPNLFNDYYYSKAMKYPKENSRIDEFLSDGDTDVLIERRKHNCVEKKIIENSIVFLDEERIKEDNIISSDNSDNETKKDLYEIAQQGHNFKKALEMLLYEYSPDPITEYEITKVAI